MRRFLLLTLFALFGAVPSASGTEIVWDTISTGRVRLVVSSVGQIGRMGSLGNGGVNMDYAGLGLDCDTSARVYLFDGGPFVMRQDSEGYYTWATSLYQSSGTTHGFVPLGDIPSQHFTGPNYDGFRTGTFVTADSSIGMRATYWAPTDLLNPIPCRYPFSSLSNNFIIARYSVFNRTASSMHKVTIGEIFDWDIPSSPAKENQGHFSWSAGSALSGTTDLPNGCTNDSSRFGGTALLGWYTTQLRSGDGCYFDQQYHQVRAALVDSLGWYQNQGESLFADYLWSTSLAEGVYVDSIATGNWYQCLTIQNDSLLKPGDTITMVLALSTVKSGNFDSIRILRAGARSWYAESIQYPKCELATCCKGQMGNIDADPSEGVDISDLSALIDYLYISFTPPVCPILANCDGDPGGGIDIADLARLIDYLYISFAPLPCCQH